MRQSKYFYLQIQGEGLDSIKLKNSIDFPSEALVKGQKVFFEPTNETIIMDINRWSYFDKSHDDTSIEEFLMKNLERIIDYKPVLEYYINKYESLLEIEIHIRDITSNFNICLSKYVISLLHKLEVKFSISFIDL
ncbi:MAG: hypothetical protein PHY08_10595 [Candidatus Cloacimonetes bacterium]|nr:hypothetical protein [Candidatus Cloacimonadota bacterium]